LFYSRELIESSLRYADVLKMNDEELRTLADLFSLSGDEATILDHLAKSHDLKLIAITKGETGSLIYSEGECSAHPGFDAEVVDSVGAGDAFTAALVLGILCAHDLDAISDHANRVAAFVCSQPGATPEIPEELGLRDRLVRCRSPH
jgi:fructokinase